MESTYIWIIVVIVLAFLIGWFIFSKILKNKKFEDKKKIIPIDISKVIEAVGGKDNIKELSASGTKITFFLNDDSKTNIESLKKLGASGVVQTKSKLTIIIGHYADDICEAIRNEITK
ncbi:MAG: PTS transporter subunit EIIB [Thomasclavelia sp.]|nr:PTS transporter subunit EIIB [Thomasclavelia sp.]